MPMINTLAKPGEIRNQAANEITSLQLLDKLRKQKYILTKAQETWEQRKQNPNYNQTLVADKLEKLETKIKDLDSRSKEFETPTSSQNQTTTPNLEKKSESSPEGKLLMELAKSVVTNMLQAQFPILNVFSLILNQQQLEIIDQLDTAKTVAGYAKEKADPKALFDRATKLVNHLSSQDVVELETSPDQSFQEPRLTIKESKLRAVFPKETDFKLVKYLLNSNKTELSRLDLLRLKNESYYNNIVRFRSDNQQNSLNYSKYNPNATLLAGT